MAGKAATLAERIGVFTAILLQFRATTTAGADGPPDWSDDVTFLEYLHLNKYKEAKQIACVIENKTPGR
jgi:hypothetical protein